MVSSHQIGRRTRTRLLVGGPFGRYLNHSKAGEAAALLLQTAPDNRASRSRRPPDELGGRNKDRGTARCLRKDTGVPGKRHMEVISADTFGSIFSWIPEFLRMVQVYCGAPETPQQTDVGNCAKSTKRCSKFAEGEELAKTRK